MNPPCNTVFNVAAVKMNDDGTRPFNRRECTNDSCQLHLVVGRKRAAAIELQSVLTPDEPGSPTPYAGIFFAGPISPNFKNSRCRCVSHGALWFSAIGADGLMEVGEKVDEMRPAAGTPEVGTLAGILANSLQLTILAPGRRLTAESKRIFEHCGSHLSPALSSHSQA